MPHTIDSTNPLAPKVTPQIVVGPDGEGAVVVAHETALAGLYNLSQGAFNLAGGKLSSSGLSAAGTAPLTLTYNASNGKITGSVTLATETVAGLMSATDKKSLDSIQFLFNSNDGTFSGISIAAGTYSDGFFGVSTASATAYIGDYPGDGNGTVVVIDDTAQTATLNAGNGFLIGSPGGPNVPVIFSDRSKLTKAGGKLVYTDPNGHTTTLATDA